MLSMFCGRGARPRPRVALPQRLRSQPGRLVYSSAATDGAEAAIADKLKAALDATEVAGEDVSGGSGSMYSIHVESPSFAGVTKIKQHRGDARRANLDQGVKLAFRDTAALSCRGAAAAADMLDSGSRTEDSSRCPQALKYSTIL